MKTRQPARPWRQAAALGAAVLAALACALLLPERGGHAAPPTGGLAAPVPQATRADARGEAQWLPPADAVRPPESLAAAAVLPAPDREADGAAPRARTLIAGTERAWYEEYRAVLRRPDADAEALLDASLEGRGADAQTVGLLRALLDTGAPCALQALVRAAEQVVPRDDPSSAGVPEFCVRTLSALAARDPGARAALQELAGRPALDPRLRRTAAARVALTGTPPELSLLASGLRGCDDPELLLGVARSLAHNPAAAAERHNFTDLPEVAADD